MITMFKCQTMSAAAVLAFGLLPRTAHSQADTRPAPPTDERPAASVAKAGDANASPASSPNDYFKNPEAKSVIDRIIKAYGGRENIEKLDRVRIVSQISAGDREIVLTLYQTRTALRRDTLSDSLQISECYAGGEDGWMRRNGALMSPPDPTLQFLKYEIDKGLLQQPLLRLLTSPQSKLKFKGKIDFRGTPCYLIETADILDRAVDHYFTASSMLQAADITHDEHGSVTQLYDRYETFKGVQYARRAIVLNLQDEIRSKMEIVKTDSDFNDSVFDRPER